MPASELTDKSFSSVVIPLRVRWKGFLENGASITRGSRKNPIDRETGQSCSIFPPVITPGFSRIEVPVDKLKQKLMRGRLSMSIPVYEISITVPLVTFSSSLKKLASKSGETEELLAVEVDVRETERTS